jgi:head-tail adaptor
MQVELETAQDLKAGAEQLVQELTAANETIAELQSEIGRHQSTAEAAQSQVKVCFTIACTFMANSDNGT